jgi:hypothetical protein
VVTRGAQRVTVLWCNLDVSSLAQARQALAEREGIKHAYLERSVGAWSREFSSDHDETRCVGKWADAAGVAGVVWTALKPRFAGTPVKPSSEQVIDYLKALDPETKRVAEECVRRAPPQIRTAYRERIERDLGWVVATYGKR